MKIFGKAILLIALFFAASCEKEEKINTIIGETDIFAVSPIAIVPPAEGGTYELTITGNVPWTIEVLESNTDDNDWCKLSATSGEKAAKIELIVSPSNSFVKNRTIVFAVKGDGKVLKSKIMQDTMVLGDDEVLVNGQIWSTKNVGAPGTFVDNVDQVGMLYQFNRKIGYPYSGNGAPEGWDLNYVNDGTDWLEENDPSPEGWRVPTTAEMVALWEIGATWVTAAQTGFSVDGIIVGIPEDKAKTATKDNLKQLGGLFLPQSGWRNGDGSLDRTWLVAVRSATSLDNISGNDIDGSKGGLSMGDSGGYRDLYGWGDGQKERAAMIRPVKKVSVEE